MNVKPRRSRGFAAPDFSNGNAHETHVFKAGNSLAIRISSSIAKQAGLNVESAVEMVVEEGVLHVRKAPTRELTILIERITPDNIHEAAFDEQTGAERW